MGAGLLEQCAMLTTLGSNRGQIANEIQMKLNPTEVCTFFFKFHFSCFDLHPSLIAVFMPAQMKHTIREFILTGPDSSGVKMP